MEFSLFTILFLLILLKWQFEIYPTVTPLLIKGYNKTVPTDCKLEIPQLTDSGHFLPNYYELSFKLNQKIPFIKRFPNRKTQQISQADFPFLIRAIQKDIFLDAQKELVILKRKIAKAEQKRL